MSEIEAGLNVLTAKANVLRDEMLTKFKDGDRDPQRTAYQRSLDQLNSILEASPLIFQALTQGLILADGRLLRINPHELTSFQISSSSEDDRQGEGGGLGRELTFKEEFKLVMASSEELWLNTEPAGGKI